jgi:hypothetical protein
MLLLVALYMELAWNRIEGKILRLICVESAIAGNNSPLSSTGGDRPRDLLHFLHFPPLSPWRPKPLICPPCATILNYVKKRRLINVNLHYIKMYYNIKVGSTFFIFPSLCPRDQMTSAESERGKLSNDIRRGVLALYVRPRRNTRNRFQPFLRLSSRSDLVTEGIYPFFHHIVLRFRERIRLDMTADLSLVFLWGKKSPPFLSLGVETFLIIFLPSWL